MKHFEEKVIIALDYGDMDSVKSLLRKLKGKAIFYKIGFELFTSCGSESVKFLKDKGCKVFLDLKYHDIPNTVYKAVKSAGKLGADIINVHAAGGLEMMKAAKRGCEEASAHTGRRIDVIAVTVLTALSNADVRRIFYDFNYKEENRGYLLDGNRNDMGWSGSGAEGLGEASGLALHLSELAKLSGLDGVVCSGHEIVKIKNVLGKDFKTVTPGIRLKKIGKSDDQKRIMSPSEAFDAGGDYIVVGREITAADDPIEALENIYRDINKNTEC